MRSFVLALLVAACVSASADFTFAGNLTVEDLEKFKFRATSLTTVNGNIQVLPAKGLVWTSVSASGSVLNATASADVIGAFHMTGLSFVPIITVGTYISGEIKFDPQFFYNAIVGKGSAQGSVGLIGFAMPGVVEVDPDGKIVGGINFCSTWTDLTKVEKTAEGVTVYTASLKNSDKAKVTEYVAASEVAGYLKFARTPVSPNSLEVVLEIDDYKYASSKNHLELIFASAVVTADGKGEVDGEIIFNNITNGFTTYAALRAEATVGKKSAKVTISAIAENDLGQDYRINDIVKGLVTTAFNLRGKVQFDYKKVAFPAGASHIIYDPVVGAGQNVYQSAPNSASSIVLSLVAVLLAVFLLF